jgi:hypothetical protein
VDDLLATAGFDPAMSGLSDLPVVVLVFVLFKKALDIGRGIWTVSGDSGGEMVLLVEALEGDDREGGEIGGEIQILLFTT